MNEEELKRIQKAAAFGAEFIPAFVSALQQLRSAEETGVPVTLTPTQAKSVLNALRALKHKS